MQVIEITRAGLVGSLEAKVFRLLGEAFFDGAVVDYYARLGVPEIILILQDGETVAGHLALYRREVGVAGRSVEIGMIGGVAVAPACRRRGHARTLVERAHAWLRDRSVRFSLLFAFVPRVYESSGYKLMRNPIRFQDHDGTWTTLVYRGGMYAELTDNRWPDQVVDLRGPIV
jgi:GNAT superfamily N-acetyltransferase